MKKQMKSGALTLRDAHVDDAAVRLRIGRDPEITRMFGVSRKDIAPLTTGECTEWVEDIQASEWAWVIDVNGAIGSCRLHSFDAGENVATFAIAIFSNAHLGKGLGTKTTRLILEHGFNDLNLSRIRLRVLAFNRRAIACYQKCGFEEIARDPRGEFVDGEWVADLIMEISERKFREHRS